MSRCFDFISEPCPAILQMLYLFGTAPDDSSVLPSRQYEGGHEFQELSGACEAKGLVDLRAEEVTALMWES